MSAFGGGGDDPFADILGDSMQKYSTEAKSTPLRRATMSGPQISNSAVGSKSFSPRRASAGASSRPDIRRPPRKAADALRNGQKPALPNSPPPPLPKSQPPSGPPGGAPVQTIGQIANPPGTKRANVNDFMRPPGSVAPRPGSRPSPGFKESLGVNPFLKIKSAHHKQKSSLLDDIDFTSPEAMLAKPVQPMRNDPYSDPSHVKTDGGVPRSRSDRVGFGPRSGRRTRGKEKEEKHQQSATTGLSPSLPPPPSSSSFSSSSAQTEARRRRKKKIGEEARRHRYHTHPRREDNKREEEDDEEEEMQPKSQRRARHHRPARDSRAPLRVDRDHDDGDSSDMEINTPEEKESKWKHLVDRLKDMGFTHEKKNIAALERYNGDINKAVHLLIQSEGSKSPPKDQKKQKPNRSSNSSSSSGHVSGQRGSASKANKIQMQWGKSTSSSKKRAASASSRRGSQSRTEASLSNSVRPVPARSNDSSSLADGMASPVSRVLMMGVAEEKHQQGQGGSTAHQLGSLNRLSRDFGTNVLGMGSTTTETGGELQTDDDIRDPSDPFGVMNFFFDINKPKQTPLSIPAAVPRTEEKIKSLNWSAETRAKRQRNSQNVIQEMITTERTYCQGLEKLLRYFVYPLQGLIYTPRTITPGDDRVAARRLGRRYSTVIRAETKRQLLAATKNAKMPKSKKHKAVIDQAECNTLFSNIELIQRLNQTFLANLEKDQHDVGQTFHDFAQYFKMYMPYVQNHDNATALLGDLTKDKRAFRNALSHIEQEAKTSLQSLLILPIQRIPRYKLLLETLIKNTHPNDPSYKGLTAALDLIRKVAAHINQSINARNDAKKLAEIQDLFAGSVELVAPHRKFIMRQAMKKVTKSGSHVPREFFLFSDLLIYGTDDVTFSDKLRLRQIMPIDKSFLVSEVHRFGHGDYLLYVSSAVKNITIAFENEADKEKWKAALTACMEDRRKKIGFNYIRRGSLLLKQKHGAELKQKMDTGPVFNSYSYGHAAEELAKEDKAFYTQMRYIDLTRKYFEGLNRQTKQYLQEQQALVKASNQFALKLRGDHGGLADVPWYRALEATSSMVAVHSQEMLRWKSVTELLIDTITWLLKGPVTEAESRKQNYEKKAYDLSIAKRNLENAIKKAKKVPEKFKSATDALAMAGSEHRKAKLEALEGVNKLNLAIMKGFADKLRLFVQVQADFHKDCYYDIRQCWSQVNNVNYSAGIANVSRILRTSTTLSDNSRSKPELKNHHSS